MSKRGVVAYSDALRLEHGDEIDRHDGVPGLHPHADPRGASAAGPGARGHRAGRARGGRGARRSCARRSGRRGATWRRRPARRSATPCWPGRRGASSTASRARGSVASPAADTSPRASGPSSARACAPPPSPSPAPSTRARRTRARGRRRRRRRRRTPAAISRARATSSAVVAPPRLTSASACLRRDPDARRARAAREAGALDEPGGGGLHAAVGLGEGGRRASASPALGARRSSAANASASRMGLVKKEPALTVSGSAGSSTMPLPRRSAQHRLAHVARAARGARPRRRARGPARRSGAAAERAERASRRSTREHDVPAACP